MNLQVERLKRLPRRPGETWQGGVAQMPLWVQEPDDKKPWRPWVAGWASPQGIKISEPSRERNAFDTVLKALADFACNEEMVGYRPARLAVRDAALAEYLREMLADMDMEIEVRDRLPVFDDLLAQTAEHFSERPAPPNALDAKGITVESMRAFAEAAAEFYRVRPWEFLSSEDLIEIEEPAVEPGLRFVTVLGAGGDTLGLGFYKSRKEYERLLEHPGPQWLAKGKHWSVLFGPVMELPFGDVDLWLDHKLPVAGEQAYPVALCYEAHGKERRPGPETLAFFEGLLRALAQTSEAQVDTGRWHTRVDTCKGPLDLTLALPYLLELQEPAPGGKRGEKTRSFNPLVMEEFMADLQRSLEKGDFENEEQMQAFVQENLAGAGREKREPATPLEQAQSLVAEAYSARGRRQVQLVHQALELSPDCADAYTLLAERSVDPDKQLEYYMQAVKAAERTLDPELFRTQSGHFWAIVETRPYMRARFGLAGCLERSGRLDEAVEHYRELLRLNPNDNQGVRFSLWPCLLLLDREEELDALLRRYQDDEGSCLWDYTRALLTFRQQGDGPLARRELRRALANNESAARYLLGEEPRAKPAPTEEDIEADEEALACAESLMDAWDETPGAMDWLEEMVEQP
jgi:tetratricopeptide (TPR) repeat protein